MRAVTGSASGPLVLRLPLAEAVAVREDALLGARLLLVAPGAADQRVEAVLLDRLEQRHASGGRCAIRAGAPGARVPRAIESSRWRDDQPLAHLGDAAVAELDHLGEVVAGVDVQQRERQAALTRCRRA